MEKITQLIKEYNSVFEESRKLAWRDSSIRSEIDEIMASIANKESVYKDLMNQNNELSKFNSLIIEKITNSIKSISASNSKISDMVHDLTKKKESYVSMRDRLDANIEAIRSRLSENEEVNKALKSIEWCDIDGQ